MKFMRAGQSKTGGYWRPWHRVDVKKGSMPIDGVKMRTLCRARILEVNLDCQQWRDETPPTDSNNAHCATCRDILRADAMCKDDRQVECHVCGRNPEEDGSETGIFVRLDLDTFGICTSCAKLLFLGLNRRLKGERNVGL